MKFGKVIYDTMLVNENKNHSITIKDLYVVYTTVARGEHRTKQTLLNLTE